MKKISLSLFFLITGLLLNAQVENTSYVNKSNEKVLQLSVVVPVDIKQAWEYFTTDRKLSEWIAPVVHIDLRCGGYIVTNYNNDKPLSDSSSIRLGIISYLDNELIVLKVNLNNNFSEKARKEDKNLQEIIQFKTVSPGHTKIISSMIGWGQGEDWDKTYQFFEKGNEWTYQEFLKLFH
jgi:hypothetical protein